MNNPLRRTSSKPIIIGHRGSGRGEVSTPSGLVKENTIDSFLAAHKLGVTWIETDVVRTADSALVLSHETNLPDGTPISQISLAQARNHGLDSLIQAFHALPDTLGMIVEVKYILDDTSDSYPSTAILASHALLEERARSSRPLAIYGFAPALPLVFGSVIKDAPIEIGLLSHGGTDLTGLIISSLELPTSLIMAHTSTLLGSRAEEQLNPFTLSQAIYHTRYLNKALLSYCPDLDQSLTLASAGIDGLCVDDLATFLQTWHNL